MQGKKWTVWTSWYLCQYCFFSWQAALWPHLIGLEDNLSNHFWHYVNYGHTHYDEYTTTP